MPAEFWVQTSLGGTATCGQHLPTVVRLAFRGDSDNAVVVDRSPAPSVPCRVYRDLPEDE
ncbi:MAG: hypothetical protein HOV84_17545 [Streptomyces sp.]|nr:hypothetical protein [Streptomyces sp.]